MVSMMKAEERPSSRASSQAFSIRWMYSSRMVPSVLNLSLTYTRASICSESSGPWVGGRDGGGLGSSQGVRDDNRRASAVDFMLP